jgi:hypothetical protein
MNIQILEREKERWFESDIFPQEKDEKVKGEKMWEKLGIAERKDSQRGKI